MNTYQLKFLHPSPEFRELMILLEIEKNHTQSQNLIAEKVGIVPAMVNRYIKGFVRKNMIKVNGLSKRKMTYHLTEQGLSRRNSLLFNYMNETIWLYKNAKTEFGRVLTDFLEQKIKKIVLYGAGETAEVVFNSARALGFKIIGIVDSDPGKQGKEFMGMEIESPKNIEKIAPEGIIITSFGFSNDIYSEIKYLEKKGIKIRRL